MKTFYSHFIVAFLSVQFEFFIRKNVRYTTLISDHNPKGILWICLSGDTIYIFQSKPEITSFIFVSETNLVVIPISIKADVHLGPSHDDCPANIRVIKVTRHFYNTPSGSYPVFQTFGLRVIICNLISKLASNCVCTCYYSLDIWVVKLSFFIVILLRNNYE